MDEQVKGNQLKQSIKENAAGNVQMPKPQETKQYTSNQNIQTQQQGKQVDKWT